MSRTDQKSISKTFVVLGLCCCMVLLGSAVLADEKDEKTDSKKTQQPAQTRTKTVTQASQEDKSVSPYLAASRKRTTQDASVKVYTNADLENIGPISDIPPTVLPAGSAEPASAETTEQANEQGWDPLAQQEQQRNDLQEHNALIAAAQAEVAAAEKKIADLEQRRRAVTNPFLPRPGEVEDDNVDWNSLTPQERLQWTNDALAAARTELQEAQARAQSLGPPR